VPSRQRSVMQQPKQATQQQQQGWLGAALMRVHGPLHQYTPTTSTRCRSSSNMLGGCQPRRQLCCSP
jgi:hypothetical protein